jgi:hypothetical protein
MLFGSAHAQGRCLRQRAMTSHWRLAFLLLVGLQVARQIGVGALPTYPKLLPNGAEYASHPSASASPSFVEPRCARAGYETCTNCEHGHVTLDTPTRVSIGNKHANACPCSSSIYSTWITVAMAWSPLTPSSCSQCPMSLALQCSAGCGRVHVRQVPRARPYKLSRRATFSVHDLEQLRCDMPSQLEALAVHLGGSDCSED